MTSKVVLVRSKRFGDERGWFSETYNESAFSQRGISDRFVQDNHSLSVPVGTLRGLHFQTPPFAQAKLVRCIRGRIFDVAVDIRRASPTFGQWVGAELSAENGNQLYVPVGFAHGFVTLEPSAEVTYKVSNVYSPENDGGVRWNDAQIGVNWPLPEGIAPTLSAKDEHQPLLRDFDSPFEYDGIPLEMIEA
ncbi:dTDP-4-dehydrorhamnose 3,5-epimerase [Ensifer canadensis]